MLDEAQRRSLSALREPARFRAILGDAFPITSRQRCHSIELASCAIVDGDWDLDRCRRERGTLVANVEVVLQAVAWHTDAASGERTVRDAAEDRMVIAEIPIVTPDGVLFIAGRECVVVGGALVGDLLEERYRENAVALRAYAEERLLGCDEDNPLRAYDAVPPRFLSRGALDVLVAATRAR
jgi:hypothetical protein